MRGGMAGARWDDEYKAGWWVRGGMAGARWDGGCEVSTGTCRAGEPGQCSAPGSVRLCVGFGSFRSAASHSPTQPWVNSRRWGCRGAWWEHRCVLPVPGQVLNPLGDTSQRAWVCRPWVLECCDRVLR